MARSLEQAPYNMGDDASLNNSQHKVWDSERGWMLKADKIRLGKKTGEPAEAVEPVVPPESALEAPAAAAAPPPPGRPPGNAYDGCDRPLGSGYHASPALQTALALCVMNLKRLIEEGRVLQRGTHWKEDLQQKLHYRPFVSVVAKLMRVADRTVEKACTAFRNYVGDGNMGTFGVTEHLPEPRKRGPAPKDYREYVPVVFDILRDRFYRAKQNNETLTIRKLQQHFAEDYNLHYTYKRMRYLTIKMGFQWGRIQQNIKSRRKEDRIVKWLKDYCAKRVAFSADAGNHSGEVHIFVDETFLHRDSTGKFSWYLNEDRRWEIGQVDHNRWAFAQALFMWWGMPDGALPPVALVKQYGHYPETLGTWECRRLGNMNTPKFLQWLRTVLEFAQQRWPSRTFVLHMDNASYHKRRMDPPINMNRAPPLEIINFLMHNLPEESGLAGDDKLGFYLNAQGEPISRRQLKAMARLFLQPEPLQIAGLCEGFGARVEWTPPYWPEQQPVRARVFPLVLQFGLPSVFLLVIDISLIFH